MIKFGSNTISSIHHGNQKIVKVYYGTNVVWSGEIPIIISTRPDPLTGMWDISDYSDNYQDYTRENFFWLGTGSIASVSDRLQVSSATTIKVITGSYRSYDPNTGKLSMLYSNYRDGSVFVSPNYLPVVLVQTLSDLEQINPVAIDERRFNIKGLFPDEYQNFTSDNFLVRFTDGEEPIASVNVLGSKTYNITSSITLEKTYDSENGILWCFMRSQGSIDNVATSAVENTWDVISNPTIYLSRTTPM